MKELAHGLTPDINVTPMIDVLLVLLVIFMLLPQKRFLVPVDLPPEHPATGPQPPQIVLALGPDRSYSINGMRVSAAELKRRLTDIYTTRPHKLLFIRTTPGWRYGEVIEVVDIARGAGVQVIGYVP